MPHAAAHSPIRFALGDAALIALADVPALLPRSSDDKAVHASTVWRWATRGVRGRKLRTCRIGGRRYTSRAALDAFIAEHDMAPAPAGQPGLSGAGPIPSQHGEKGSTLWDTSHQRPDEAVQSPLSWGPDGQSFLTGTRPTV